MKNKIVINIMLAYFVVLTLVLVSQIPRKNDVIATEPVVDNVEYEEKLNNAVVIYDNSPVMLVNKQQYLVNNVNTNIVPYIEDGIAYAPLSFFKTAYGAYVDLDIHRNEATIRLNNTAVVLSDGSNTAKVISSSAEKTLTLSGSLKIGNNTGYIPIDAFTKVFDKNTMYYDKLVIVSNAEDIFDENIDNALLSDIEAQVNNLPIVASEEKLKELLGSDKNNKPWYKQLINDAVVQETESAGANKGHSTTNVQVAGVDEADVIKTDGDYIYYVNKKNGLTIVKTDNYDNMKLMTNVEMEADYYPVELYLKGNKLVVLGNMEKYDNTYHSADENEPIVSLEDLKVDRKYIGMETRAYIYDITNKAEPILLRQVAIDGRYQDSRRIGNMMYIISNANTEELYKNNKYVQPSYTDTAVSESATVLDYGKVRYFPEMINVGYTVIAGVDIEDSNVPIMVNAYLGAGENIYMSEENLYIATQRYTPFYYENGMELKGGNNTNVYKFALSNGNLIYKGKTNVKGYVLNQFSMDEYNGYFRMATTYYNKDTALDENYLYVMDSEMQMCGSIEQIAVSEKLYSARFAGDRGYMVTFRTTDPLFVIDLSEPEDPKILGTLKIPGYSDYLHPYDETHLIGFGKDTTEYDGNAYYKGMKISMFDVSDLSNPVELFTQTIGDRGTESPILYDHKALTFDKGKNILSFPVELYELSEEEKTAEEETPIPINGHFKYQGAYVYGIDMEEGFVLKGHITHITDEEYLKMGDNYADDGKSVERILYIGDSLYTVSQDKIVACNINDMANTATVKLGKN